MILDKIEQKIKLLEQESPPNTYFLKLTSEGWEIKYINYATFSFGNHMNGNTLGELRKWALSKQL